MIGQYEIKVNGLKMGAAPTFKGALALVTKRYHLKEGVTVERGGIVLWTSDEKR